MVYGASEDDHQVYWLSVQCRQSEKRGESSGIIMVYGESVDDLQVCWLSVQCRQSGKRGESGCVWCMGRQWMITRFAG